MAHKVTLYITLESEYKGMRDVYKLDIDFEYFIKELRPKIIAKGLVNKKKAGEDLTEELHEVLIEEDLKDKLEFIGRTEDVTKTAEDIASSTGKKVLRIKEL